MGEGGHSRRLPADPMIKCRFGHFAEVWGQLVSRSVKTFLLVCAATALSVPANAQADLPLKFQCIVRDAQILAARTQVRCANRGLNGLSEFAADTNQPYAGRVASAIVQALRTGAPLVLTYAPAVELNPNGCDARICRKIIDVGGQPVMARAPAPAPFPQSSPQPRVEPADFDPVDDVVYEPRAVAPTPQPAPKSPAVDPYRMRPISD
jgi:hypothetical protein